MRCIISFLLIIIAIAFLGGLYVGFGLGRDSICGDVAFYYNNDLPISGCNNDNGSTKGRK